MTGNELKRQGRVLRQTLSMHAMLRDRYQGLAFAIDIALLACSVIFCAITFAGDGVFSRVGLSSENARDILGVASVIAFFASLVALRAGWKERSARHADAVRKLTDVMAVFRKSRTEDGGWAPDDYAELQQAYWEAMNNVVPIPDRLFVALKARHVRKVELSRMLETSPGSPLFMLRFVLLCRYLKKLISKKAKDKCE